MAKALPWETKLAMLKKFKEVEGNTLVRQGYADPQTGFRLGRWVANVRQRASFLSEKQLQDLQEVGFFWNHLLPWDTKIKMLKKYKDVHGDTLVPTDNIDPESGFRLGEWVNRVRRSKRFMNKARVQELEELGFVWKLDWETMFHLLQHYKEENHHVSPDASADYQGAPLGQWVSLQRHLYSRKRRCLQYNSNISEEQISLLDSVSFDWSVEKGGTAPVGADYDTDATSGETTMDDSCCSSAASRKRKRPSANAVISGFTVEFNLEPK
jgi:hypothetical protein